MTHRAQPSNYSMPSTPFAKDNQRPSSKLFLNNPDGKQEGAEDAEKQSTKQSENITFLKVLLFLIYTVSFLLVIHLRIDFQQYLNVNTALSRDFLNQIQDFAEYEQISLKRIRFRDITVSDNITNWIQNSVIRMLYEDYLGTVIEDMNKENRLRHFSITSLRLLQKRARIINQPENENFPQRWDLSTSEEDKSEYGPAGNTFKYDSKQGGFNVTIPTPPYTFQRTMEVFNECLSNGFIDFQTKHLMIDFTVYHVRLELASYFRAWFDFSGSGKVRQKFSEIVTFPTRFYTDTRGIVSLVFQIIFAFLFIFYFFEELYKIKISISNCLYLNRKKKENKGALALVQAQASGFRELIRSIVKGIFRYLSDPWSFVNACILVFSLLTIIFWLIIGFENRLYELLEVYDPNSAQTVEEYEQIIYMSNYEMEQVKKNIILFLQFAAVNILMIMVKLLKYVTVLNRKMKELFRILQSVTNRMMPYYILLLVILIAYSCTAFYLYGDTLKDFSDFFTAFVYLVTGLDYNYYLMDQMIAVDEGITIFFYILFFFIVMFIMCYVLFIYIMRAVDEYMKKRAQRKKSNIKSSDTFNFRPHFLWKLSNACSNSIPLFFYKKFSATKYSLKKSKIEANKKKEERELSVYKDFNFNLNIQETDEKARNLDPIFNTEVSIIKVKQQRKIKVVKLIWSVIALWVAFILLNFITADHHKIVQASNVIESLTSMYEQTEIREETPEEGVSIFAFEIGVKKLANPGEVSAWISQLFVAFDALGSYAITDGRNYSGYFLADTNYLLSGLYRLTIRQRSLLPIPLDPYHAFHNVCYSEVFKAEARNPSGELTSDFIGRNGTVYPYTEGGGYDHAGGYTWSVPIADFPQIFQDLDDNWLINYGFNSLVIDFPLINVMTEDIIYAILKFELTEGAGIEAKVDISYLGLTFYKEAKDRFFAVIEVILIICLVVSTYKLYFHLKRRINRYDYWYSLHIQHFPSIMKKQRRKAKPEFMRKIMYVISLSSVINLGLLICGFGAVITWITYLIEVPKTQKLVDQFLDNSPDANNDELLHKLSFDIPILETSKVFESLFLFLIAVKIVYLYSYFSSFKFLSETLKKSIKWSCWMCVILFGFVLAFGFFKQFVRGTTDPLFAEFTRMVIAQIQNLNGLGVGEWDFLTGPYEVFMAIVYYIPWLVFVTYAAFTMFTGIIYYAYKVAIEEEKATPEDKSKLTVKEFFVLTFKMLQKKKKVQQQKAHFEVNEQIRSNFDYQKVFGQFDDTVDMAYNTKDIKIWATNCTQNIVNENECRKTIRRISKEVFKASVVDFDFVKNEHKKIMDDKQKFSQFELRLKFWNYFKYGSDKLLQHMKTFNQVIDVLEKKTGDPETQNVRNKVDDKIRKYIMQLESQISQNLHDVQRMKTTLDEYEKEKLIGHH